MAILDNSILNGLGNTFTGNTNKAYILLHKPEMNPAERNEAANNGGMGGLSGLSGAASKLQDSMSLRTNREMGISSSKLGVVNSIDSDLKRTANAANFLPVQVQYSPSSISFQGNGGEIRRESVGGSGENEFQQFDRPSETIMGMELIFDDTNNKDAFMMDAELPLLSEIASVGGLAQRIEQGVTAVRGKTYSVQDTTELFVAAMVQNFTRLVGFAWNKMIFWGELVGVSVSYTMFNKAGAPIRAKVSLQIRQDQAIPGQTPYATEEQWEEAFNDLFESGTGNNAFGIKNSDSTNWLNGNFLNLG